MEFLLASGNSHKAEEFSELFDQSVINVVAASEKLDVEETGATYNENAFLNTVMAQQSIQFESTLKSCIKN